MISNNLFVTYIKYGFYYRQREIDVVNEITFKHKKKKRR